MLKLIFFFLLFSNSLDLKKENLHLTFSQAFSRNISIIAVSWYYHYREPCIVIISYREVPCESHPY